MKEQHVFRAIMVPRGGEDDSSWFVSPIGNVGPAFFDGRLPAGLFFAQKEMRVLEEIGIKDAKIVKVRVTIEVIS